MRQRDPVQAIYVNQSLHRHVGEAPTRAESDVITNKLMGRFRSRSRLTTIFTMSSEMKSFASTWKPRYIAECSRGKSS